MASKRRKGDCGYLICEDAAKKAAQMIMGGKPFLHVAAELGYNHCTLRSALKRYGLMAGCSKQRARSGPAYKITKKDATAAAKELAGGKHFALVAQLFGVNAQTLRDALERYNLRYRFENADIVRSRLSDHKT